MRRRVTSRVTAVLTGVAAAASLAVLPVLPAGAAGFCALPSAGLTVFTWDGSVNDQWSEPGNWANNLEPNAYASTGYVCIPGSAPNNDVIIGDGIEGNVQMVDVEGGASLTIQDGGKLFVFGDQATRPSIVRAGAALTLRQGALGGSGRINLNGSMTWRSEIDGVGTITTRECGIGGAAEPGDDGDPDACATAVSGQRGLLVVGDNATVQVDGRGVNLFDEYRLLVRGTVRLSGEAYVAADRGTRFELRPKASGTGVGRLVIDNAGGIYEGRTNNGVTGLAAVVNAGLILKRAAGASVIAATYTEPGAGRIVVRQGVLSLPELPPATPPGPAAVTGGATLGAGRCAAGSTLGCQPVTEGAITQAAALTVPGADTNGAQVQIFTRAGVAKPANTAGRVLEVHALGLAATAGKPAVLTLRFDSSLLDGRTVGQVQVLRQAKPGKPFVVIKACRPTGKPPVGQIACVDRRGLPASSRNAFDPGDDPNTDDPDVVLVVRTTGTSRWVGRLL